MLNTDIEVAYDIDVDNFGEGTSCEVVVKNAMHKDNGTWRFQIGTGENWSEMKQELFLYNVFVEGTSIMT